MYLHVAGISAYHMSGDMKNFSFYFQAYTQVVGGEAKNNDKRYLKNFSLINFEPRYQSS